MEETTKAYMAGLFDGEGTICIVRSAHQSFIKQYNRKYPYYAINLRIGMIDKDAIDMFYNELGVGRLDLEKKWQYKRPMYRWRTSQKEECAYVINLLLPYFRVKKPQALLALDFIKNVKKHMMKEEFPQLEEDKRFNYWVQMRTLNGIASPATTKPLGDTMRSPRPQQRTIRIETIV